MRMLEEREQQIQLNQQAVSNLKNQLESVLNDYQS